jgi:uncharacterized Fe-S cluster protein YjdI
MSSMSTAARPGVDWSMGDDHIKKYSNGEVTVIWRPAICQHTGVCARGLPAVFNPRRRPWIELQHADTKAMVAQVDRCPSGALSSEPAKGGAD